MQVLKFGGTSVANAQSISQVVDIVSKAAESDRTILVCSAISKCTDTLIKIGNLASSGDSEYVTFIDELQERHHRIILELLPIEKQAELIEEVLSKIKLSDMTKDLAQLCSLRLENPDISLDELGKMMKPELSRSAVSRRFKKLEKIAAELKTK